MLDLQKINTEITCIAVKTHNEYINALCYGINCNLEKLKERVKEGARLKFLSDSLISNPTCLESNLALCLIKDRIKEYKSEYSCDPVSCSDTSINSCNITITDITEQILCTDLTLNVIL